MAVTLAEGDVSGPPEGKKEVMCASRRLGVLLALVAVTLLIIPGSAQAQDLSDTPDGDTGWAIYQTAAANGLDPNGAMGLLDPLACNGCTTVTFGTFTDQDNQTVKLKAYEYLPPSSLCGTTTTCPAMVLVHGGGWIGGSRQAIEEEALTFSGNSPSHLLGNDSSGNPRRPFIVFSISYRIDCDFTGDTTGVNAYCGWWYGGHVDGTAGETQGAIHDVQTAVSWVKTHGGDVCGCFNGKVALVGSSSGANLAYTVAALSSPGDQSRPDAVSGWSGPVEFVPMNDPPVDGYMCDESSTAAKKANCWKNVNRYLCDKVSDDHYDSSCDSAYSNVNVNVTQLYQANDPPIFFANGGGGMAGPESIPLQQAKDLRDRLVSIRFLSTAYTYCAVNSSAHASVYLYDSMCLGEMMMRPVYLRNVDFLNRVLP